MRLRAGALVVAALSLAGPSRADGVEVDRAVLRFVSRETGGVEAPRFVYARELAFEARLEALSEGGSGAEDPPYRARHVRAAVERHIAETVLESLGITPTPTKQEVASRIEQARLALLERVGGLVPLTEAARAEGIGDSEVLRLLRREALASLYLDRMVAPMLDPTDAELRTVHRTQRTPFSGRPYADVSGALRRWYVGTRLAASLASYYDGLRTRLVVTELR
ncbi:MAG TPA: hypothetical protein VHE30_04200 [Polyangiaceae bacterium]|nr:hypothetical protein [Polyangiaceae bacterium]